MKLTLIRYDDTGESSGGLMFIDGKFFGHTVEDESRDEKVMHETRIPEGTFDIKLRNAGGMNERYREKFGTSHQGMLHLQDVPGFTWIYIHVGTHEGNTSGCILVGYGTSLHTGEHRLSHSTDAYVDLYDKICAELQSGGTVDITIQDMTR